MPLPYKPPSFDHPNNIWRRKTLQIIEILTIQFSPASCHFIPLRSKYSPQHPVFKHLQCMFFPVILRCSNFIPKKKTVQKILMSEYSVTFVLSSYFHNFMQFYCPGSMELRLKAQRTVLSPPENLDCYLHNHKPNNSQ
jgi:hypothetical protein